jgi:hypothetical protein
MDPQTLCAIEPLSCWAQNFPFRESVSTTADACAHSFFGMCLIVPELQNGGIFGFAEFVQGFALLALIYTVSDVRYRFRMEAAPIPLYPLTLYLATFIGLGTLVSDVWFARQYPLPSFISARAIWQAVFGGLFLVLVLAWLLSSFVWPTRFGRFNRLSFARTLYYYLLQGAETDLPSVAVELARSAAPLIKHAQKQTTTGHVAHDLLLLIGVRKFCRHIAARAPGTAIEFFNQMTDQKKYPPTIMQFAVNISTEAILNKDSILYHEDEGFYSGYFGYVRPFTNAVYGDFRLMEALGNNTPLDVNFDVRTKFDADHLTAYTRAFLVTFKSAVNANKFYARSSVLFRAFKVVSKSCHDLYKLNNKPEPPDAEDIQRRLGVVVSFIEDAIDVLDKHGIKKTRLRRHDINNLWRDDLYDDIADLMFDVIKNASAVKKSDLSGWFIQHNSVWSQFFRQGENKTRAIILFKLRRLIYEEIRSIERVPHFVNAAVLGLCLNVMGLSLGNKRDFRVAEYPVRKVVLSWAKKHYLWMVKRGPKAAQAAEVGWISFDAENKRLVQSFNEGLRKKAFHVYLTLDEPTLPFPRSEDD